MRKPGNSRNEQRNQQDSFINAAEGEKLPWKKKLDKKYNRDTGKTVNVRLPEYYAECLQYLAEQDSRSQHGELVHLIGQAIDQSVSDIKKVSK